MDVGTQVKLIISQGSPTLVFVPMLEEGGCPGTECCFPEAADWWEPAQSHLL